MLTLSDGIPRKCDALIANRSLYVLNLCRIVLAYVSLNRLTLATYSVLIVHNDAVVVVSFLSEIVDIVTLLTWRNSSHRLYLLAIAHDAHIKFRIRVELAAIDSLRRSREVNAHLERSVDSCGC